MTRNKAEKLRELIEMSSASLPDKEASEGAELLRSMKYDGKLIHAGVRINWNGVVKKAAVDIWDNAGNNPDNAPTLWEDIEYKDGYRIIPEVITVTKMFGENEIGWWKDELYKSKVNGNVYTPEQYPPNWEKI